MKTILLIAALFGAVTPQQIALNLPPLPFLPPIPPMPPIPPIPPLALLRLLLDGPPRPPLPFLPPGPPEGPLQLLLDSPPTPPLPPPRRRLSLLPHDDDSWNDEAVGRIGSRIKCIIDRSSCNVIEAIIRDIGEDLLRSCPGCNPLQKLVANTILGSLESIKTSLEDLP